MSDWRDEAVGVEVREGGAVVYRDEPDPWNPQAAPKWQTGRAEYVSTGEIGLGGGQYSGPRYTGPDLADLDERAVFDRRLVLRRGHPENGGRVFVHGCHLFVGGGHVWAGKTTNEWIHVKTDDPILARIRAWKLVTS